MEIERKYLVDKTEFKKFLELNPNCITSTLEISQFYIPALDGTFRLRRTKNPNNSFSFVVTLKKFVSNGVNEETEVHIDSNVAHDMINNIKGLKSIKKTRQKITFEERIWEVDTFTDSGLVLAEVELNDINEKVHQPFFIRDDVTDRREFTNEYLANLTSVDLGSLKDIFKYS